MSYFEKLEELLELEKKQDAIDGGVAEMLRQMGRADEDTAKRICEDLDGKPDAVHDAGRELWDIAKKKRTQNCYYMAAGEAQELIAKRFGIAHGDKDENKPANKPETIDFMDLLGV